jgi:hypothetical protein
MYRIQASETEVSGSRYAWDSLGEFPASYTTREVDKAHARTRRFLRKHYCGKNLNEGNGVVWCEIPIKDPPDWAELLRKLDPDRLRTLPPQDSLGSAECIVEDGTGVGVEIVDRDGLVRISYGNPQECCPWPECRVMENVMNAVEEVH